MRGKAKTLETAMTTPRVTTAKKAGAAAIKKVAKKRKSPIKDKPAVAASSGADGRMSYKDMITQAIPQLNSRTGVTTAAIKNHLKMNFNIAPRPEKFMNYQLRTALGKLVEENVLVADDGKGTAKRYRLVPKRKKAERTESVGSVKNSAPSKQESTKAKEKSEPVSKRSKQASVKTAASTAPSKKSRAPAKPKASPVASELAKAAVDEEEASTSKKAKTASANKKAKPAATKASPAKKQAPRKNAKA